MRGKAIVVLGLVSACARPGGEERRVDDETQKPVLFSRATAASGTLLRCARSARPSDANAYSEVSECVGGAWSWTLEVQAELSAQRLRSCQGPPLQSLPVYPLDMNGPVMAGWDGSAAAWALTARIDQDRFAHPCGVNAVTRVSLARDAQSGGGLLPGPATLTTDATLTYSTGLRPGAGARAFIAFIGVWDGLSHRVEVNLRSSNWADSEPQDPEVVSRIVSASGEVWLTVEATALPGSQGSLGESQPTDVRIEWNPLLRHLAQRGLIPAPVGGWERSFTRHVSLGQEFASGSQVVAGMSQLRTSRLELGGTVTIEPCADSNAQQQLTCDGQLRRCAPNPASPSGFAWISDSTCRNGAGGGSPGGGGVAGGTSAGGGVAGGTPAGGGRVGAGGGIVEGTGGGSSGAGGGTPVDGCGTAASERNACHPSIALRRCTPDGRSPTGFAWQFDASCQAPEPCGGSNAAQRGRCSWDTAGKRCAASALSGTGYGWVVDPTCQPIEQCGASNPAQRGACSWDTAGKRCAVDALSPSGYAWVSDSTCRPIEVCGSSNPAQRGACSWDTAGRRCAANPLSPTGYAWAGDSSCQPITPCAGTNPAQAGQCSPSIVGQRCASNALSPTQYAWASDSSCVPRWILVQSCQPNQCPARGCTTPSNPEGLSCPSALGQICNTPTGGRTYRCGY
jgi:hypothetical protein